MTEILRYTAFTTDPAGGNPAGVVLDARGLTDAQMQQIAADVGYSETAFFSPREDGAFDVRYFSPRAEVTFCGHATVAAVIAHAQRHGAGERTLHTRAGIVRVDVDAGRRATLVSVAPRVEPLADEDLAAVLAALRWDRDELDPALPPAIGYAGAWHPVIAVASVTAHTSRVWVVHSRTSTGGRPCRRALLMTSAAAVRKSARSGSCRVVRPRARRRCARVSAS